MFGPLWEPQPAVDTFNGEYIVAGDHMAFVTPHTNNIRSMTDGGDCAAYEFDVDAARKVDLVSGEFPCEWARW